MGKKTKKKGSNKSKYLHETEEARKKREAKAALKKLGKGGKKAKRHAVDLGNE
jgi:hypothetical protein